MIHALAALLVVTATASSGWAGQDRALADLQRSHIEANAPTSANFDRLLRRDIEAYFADQGVASSSLQYELLRDAPTQSGVALPKYYLWVRVVGPDNQVIEGAMRVAAVDRERFDVTDFVNRAVIAQDPASLEWVLPAMLVPLAISRAHAPAQ